MGCYVWLWFEESRNHGPSDVLKHIESRYAPEDFTLTKHRPGVYEMTFWTPDSAWSVLRSVTLEEFPPLLKLLLANPGQEATTRSQLEEYQRTYHQIRIP